MANIPLSNSKVITPVNATGDSDPKMDSRGNLESGGTRQNATSNSVADYRAGEIFSEKMIQDEACMRSELKILRNKFLKSEEEVRNLESKVLNMNNEIAMLKVEHSEDVKLWKGMDSKFLATSTFSDHLAETLTLLESQLKEAEQSKTILEERLAEREKFYDDTKSHVDIMSAKIKTAETSIREYEATVAKLRDTLQQQTTTLATEIANSKKLSAEKNCLQQQLSKAVSGRQEDKDIIDAKAAEIQLLTKKLLSKAEDVADLQNKNLVFVQTKGELELQLKDLQNFLNLSRKDNETLQEKIDMLNLKASELQKANALATCTIENLHSESARRAEQAEEDKKEQERRVNGLMQRLSESEKYVGSTRQDLREKTQEVETLLKKVADSAAEIETAKDEATRMRQEYCEKQQLIEQMSQQEHELRREIQEVRGNWTAAENAAKELNVRFKHQLEAKQTELTIHLQEISQRNNQEMADMRRRYEEQTREAAAEEKRKGEAALEAIRQASEQELSRELDAANQRLKSAQKDHEDMVRLIKEASEKEKEKLVEFHAEELRTKQQEFQAEMEKRCGDVSLALQHQNEELKRFQREEIKKLQATLDILLETAQEVDSLKEQIKKLKRDHEEELANKIQALEAKFDVVSHEHEAEILKVESSSTRKIEEWKSKAVLWQIEFIKLRTASREGDVLEKEGARTSSTPLNNVEDVPTNGGSAAKDNELKCADTSENYQSDDPKLKSAELAEKTQNKDFTVSRTLPSATSVVPREVSAKGSHTQWGLRSKSNEVALASTSLTAKDFDEMEREQKQKVNELAVMTRNHSATQGQLQGNPETPTGLETLEGKEVILKKSRRTIMVSEFPHIGPSLEVKGTPATRRKISTKVSGWDCEKIETSQPSMRTSLEKLKRKSKRVKFNETQKSEELSRTLCDLFKMEELMDPYDDPYVFNE